MPQILSRNNNIENVISRGTLNYFHVFLWLYKIMSLENLTNLFTKSLPTLIFKKLVHNIRIHHLKYLS
jgi:hypothetical protein